MTATTNKGFNLPSNAQMNWDTPLNQNFNWLDTAFGGTTNLNVVGASGVVTLTQAQYLPPNIVAAGAMTANVNYQLPSGVGGRWSVFNNTSGAFSITISSAGGGVSATIPQGFRRTIISDGTNVSYDDSPPPAGADGMLQYNHGGILWASSNLTFDGTNLLVGSGGAVRLGGSTSGYVALKAPAAAGSVTWTLPANDGSSGQFLTTNGAGVLQWTSVGAGVTSFSGGSTGLTPSTGTTGAVVLGGTLAIANGGTGTNSATGSGALVLASAPTLANPTFTGTVSGLPTATTAVSGISPMATAAQVIAGSDTAHSVTPAALKGLLYESSPTGITLNTQYTVTHSLGVVPKDVWAVVRCANPELGYAVNDEVPVRQDNTYGGGNGQSVGVGIRVGGDASTINYFTGRDGIYVPNLTIGNGVWTTITPGNWAIVIRARAY